MMLDHPSLSVLSAYPDHEPQFVNEETNACQRPPDDNATFLHVLVDRGRRRVDGNKGMFPGGGALQGGLMRR